MVSLVEPIRDVVALGDIFLKEWRYSDGATATPRNVDTGAMLLRFENGAQGSFRASWVAADGPGWALEIFGSEGRLRAESPAYPTAETTRLYAGRVGTSSGPQGEWIDLPGRLFSLPDSLLDPAQADSPAAKTRQKGPQDLSNARLYRGMIEAIREGREASPGFVQACHVQQVLEAAHRSIESHHWEPIEA
jgi:predicted dehydrogenase